MEPIASSSSSSTLLETPGVDSDLMARQTVAMSKTSGKGKGLRAMVGNLPQEIVIKRKSIQELTATAATKVAEVFNRMLDGDPTYKPTRYQVMAAMRLAGLLELQKQTAHGNLHIHLGIPRPGNKESETPTSPVDERSENEQ